MSQEAGDGRSAGVHAFLIADLRGYTTFTDERGDEAAASLTSRFAAVAGVRVDANGGTLVELRGDEVLARFTSPRDCLRAAIELHGDLAADDFPLRAGVGIDVGEAAPAGEGYRGRAINMAARLCSRAGPGETLVTQEFAHLAGSIEGISFEDGGPVHLKGLSRPIHLVAAVALDGEAVRSDGGALACAILGPLEVTVGGRPTALGGPKQRLVLAHLLLAVNRVVLMEELIDALWDEEPPKAARNTIQSYVSHLRGALGPERIESRSPGYLVHAEPEELDLLRFERALSRARRWIEVDPERAVAGFDDALSLWRGTPLADLAGTPSLAGEISRLEELRLAAIEDRLQARLALNERDLVGELQPLVDRYPLRERLWGQLMLALYRAGRQGEALAAYDRSRAILADELGVDPSPDLRELHAKILQQDASLDASGRPLRSYRLIEQIGSGADGVVWRGIDPAVGREVAIKQIAPELARQPSFVRRFQQEAELIARLEHPHIVPLYDAWRDGNGAYLVMRLLRGGSVADALTDGPLPIDRVTAIVEQVAGALAAVHRHRLVHRDVRAENVLLDEEGNAYLSDLGIATEVGSQSPADDVAALARLAATMLGQQSPAHVADVLEGAELGAGFEDAPSFARALAAASAQPAAPPPATSTIAARNPYKGLRPFSEADAGDFFGRDALTDRLVERMREEPPEGRFLALVGPSGSGKSSVVRAGLLPALRAGAVPGSREWFIAEMLPGPRPMDELESALLRAGVDPSLPLLDGLERDAHGLTASIERVLPADDSELLLLVDQFEEVFTLVDDENPRARFLESLVLAVTDPGSRLRVIVTLRADFFDRPLSYAGLAELVRARSETIVPLTAEELEQAISGPATQVGVVPERALVAEAVGDVTDQPGALPLLQYALTETFDARSEAVLTLESYRATGGVTGALAKRAEQLYDAMNDGGREAARQLFLRLVSVGEGAEDTRRLVTRTELASLEVDQRSMTAAIDVFGKHRLLSFDRDPDTSAPTVEVAHEALLRAWGRLRGWIDAAREDVIAHRRLASEADQWDRSGRDPSFLLRGIRLAQLDAWAASTSLALSDAERRLLTESVDAREAHVTAEREREERERALERRSVNRMRGLVAVLAAAALIATSLGLVAISQRGKARAQANIAQARELAAAADANLTTDPERSVLLALEAVETRQRDGTPFIEAVQSLQNAVAANRLLLRLADPSTGNVAYSPDGRLIATGGAVGGTGQTDVLLWDAYTGTLLHRLEGHRNDIQSVAFDPTGTMLVSTSADLDAIIWDTANGRTVRRVPRLGVSAQFDPKGQRIIATNQGVIQIAEVANGRIVDTISEPDVELCSPSFSPDGSKIATGRCGWEGLEIRDAATHRIERVLGSEIGVGFLGGIFSPDGTRIAANAEANGTFVWEVSTGEQLTSITGYRGSAYGLAFSPDGTTVATGGTDGAGRVWDASDGGLLEVLAGHQGLVSMVAFGPDGSRLVTGGADGAARVWDVRVAAPGLVLGGRTFNARIMSVAFAPDGGSLFTVGDRGGWIWDLASSKRTRSLERAWGAGTVTPDGSSVIAASDRAGRPGDGAGAWRWDTGKRSRFLETPRQVKSTSVSDAGVAALGLECCDGPAVLLWDPAEPNVAPVRFGRTTPETGGMTGVSLSPDGSTLIAIDGFGTLRVWDVASGQMRFKVTAQSGQGTGVALSPDGTTIATVGAEGLTLLDARDGALLASPRGLGALRSLAFSVDGRFIATGGEDNRTTIWEAATGRPVRSVGGSDAAPITGVAFSPDGSLLATADEAGLLKTYAVALDPLEAIGRAQITRELTDAECSQYLHEATCPDGLATPTGTPAAPPNLPLEGAFRSDVSVEDLSGAGLRLRQAARARGAWTLTLAGGRYVWYQDDPVYGPWQTSGAYTIEGDRLTLVDDADPDCFGTTLSVTWRLDGSDLLLHDAVVTPPCRQVKQLAAVAEAHPWPALTHHALVG